MFYLVCIAYDTDQHSNQIKEGKQKSYMIHNKLIFHWMKISSGTFGKQYFF